MMKACIFFVSLGMIGLVACDQRVDIQDHIDEISDNHKYFELCPNKNDGLKCMQNFFHKNAECTPVKHIDKNPSLYKNKYIGYMPKINSTIYLKDTLLSELDGEMEAFLYDKTTGNVIMSVRMKNAKLDSANAVLYMNQRSKAPKALSVHASGTHDIVITAVIQHKKRITKNTISQSLISVYFPEGYAKALSVVPKNKHFKDEVAAIMTNVEPSTLVPELFITGGQYFFQAYLEKYICKFGFPYENV